MKRARTRGSSQTTSEGAGGDRLSRDRILRAAVSLVSRDGVESLSMRRLAQDLDVWPMSIYRYFQDKDELLSALADTVAEDIDPPPTTGPWREQMTVLMRQVKALLERHPGSLGPERNGAAAARVRSVGTAILERAPLAVDESEQAWYALLAYTAGAASLRSSEGEFEYGLGRLLDGLEAKPR